MAVVAPSRLTDTTPAIAWLLASEEPAVGYLTRRDVLGERLEPDPEAIAGGPVVSAFAGRAGRLGDERANDALGLLVRRRRPDGRWQPLNALRVLRMAGDSRSEAAHGLTSAGEPMNVAPWLPSWPGLQPATSKACLRMLKTNAR
ncbi:MAG: hypothetical protein E6J00_14455 [Chloroflexi bacterium]|nr:MAG: hypothetical protein E6J00_14455 [Chloroflexota bacterium]